MLERKFRIDRLREIRQMVESDEKFSAFDLAVRYGVSLNMIYRDINLLKSQGEIPKDFAFARRNNAKG